MLYIPFIIALTFFYPERERRSANYEYHFIPFQGTIAQIKNHAQYITPAYWQVFAKGLLGNLLLFIPLGFFLRFFFREKNFTLLLYALALSVSIELTQLCMHLGVCDVDDVILNSAGAYIGIIFCCVVHKNNKEVI